MRSDLRILFVVLAVGLLSMSVEAQDPPPSKQQVSALIQKLDSNSFAERKYATSQLKDWGKSIVPYLSEARNTVVSEEVRTRLDSLLHFHRSPTALGGHTDWIMGVNFAPDGSRVVSVSRDRTLRMWDLASRKSIYQSPPMQTPLETAIFTPDGKQMIVCGGNLRGGLNELKLCSAANGETIHHFAGHKGLKEPAHPNFRCICWRETVQLRTVGSHTSRPTRGQNAQMVRHVVRKLSND